VTSRHMVERVVRAMAVNDTFNNNSVISWRRWRGEESPKRYYSPLCETNVSIQFNFNSNILLNKMHKFNYTISNGIAHQA